jgi:hypothetical protein
MNTDDVLGYGLATLWWAFAVAGGVCILLQ